jgi:hypothetical protein
MHYAWALCLDDLLRQPRFSSNLAPPIGCAPLLILTHLSTVVLFSKPRWSVSLHFQQLIRAVLRVEALNFVWNIVYMSLPTAIESAHFKNCSYELVACTQNELSPSRFSTS